MEDIAAIIKAIGIAEIKYDKNTYLLRQSKQVLELIFCEDASLTVSYLNSSGNEFILKVESNYTGFLGEMEFFQENNHSLFNIRSNKSGVLYRISKANFIKIVDNNASMLMYITSLITKRYNRNMHELISNLTQSTKVSIINQILEARNLANEEQFKISSTLGAKRLGITTRSYRRIINELIQEGKIIKSKPFYKIIKPLI
ncbi:Crp/Fnr family transcriptional regulator [Shewanella oncorhynchi]|jgi:CRP-like cAMP-binding protein|uniref:Crp/Fnr family transcriptional regulator n=1 Tax=Shewanella TaxID=22 RepID=UPI0021DB2B84|nr:Crp/Fnr family transcriptional regulator [Shewanella sp. SM95]MCU8000394.1 Crp/Fnr family transcriptional regulator [Shewanella sp. SM95]